MGSYTREVGASPSKRFQLNQKLHFSSGRVLAKEVTEHLKKPAFFVFSFLRF